MSSVDTVTPPSVTMTLVTMTPVVMISVTTAPVTMASVTMVATFNRSCCIEVGKSQLNDGFPNTGILASVGTTVGLLILVSVCLTVVGCG